jgi:putative DNA primase/helicase
VIRFGERSHIAKQRRGANVAASYRFELYSEDDAAKFFVHEFGNQVRYCNAAGGWLIWDGRRFARDMDGAIMRLVSECTDRILRVESELDDLKERKRMLDYVTALRRRRGLENVAALASSKLPIAVASSEAFDANPWSLNVRNGTIDLLTGTLNPHERSEMNTKMVDVPYHMDAICPRWDRFQNEIFGGDEELIGFARRAVGYSLTGDISEHAFFMLHGRGANGKSTFVETILAMLGDYAQASNPETWLRQGHGGRGADPGVARLPGVRMVTTAELGEGRGLDEARVKQIVAGDRTATRGVYQAEFDFLPACKLWISTNHAPQIGGTDDGIWRRMLFLPFTQQFTGADVDRSLGAKLRGELAGILAWAVQGCLEWQHGGGLRPPAAVMQATAEYRADSDVTAQFIAEACEADAKCSVGASQLFAAYKRWSEAGGERSVSQRRLGLTLRERGFQSVKDGRGLKMWRGIGLTGDYGGNG